MILESNNQMPKIVIDFDILFPFPKAFFKVSSSKDIPEKEGKTLVIGATLCLSSPISSIYLMTSNQDF